MIFWLTLLLGCQLVGEVLSAGTRVGIPGPVCGMVLLFLGLLVWGRVPEALGKTADALLGNLSVLFVPAAVGIMLHFQVLEGEWLAISLAIVVSTGLTIAITASLMAYFTRQAKPKSLDDTP